MKPTDKDTPIDKQTIKTKRKHFEPTDKDTHKQINKTKRMNVEAPLAFFVCLFFYLVHYEVLVDLKSKELTIILKAIA